MIFYFFLSRMEKLVSWTEGVEESGGRQGGGRRGAEETC